MDPHEIHHIKAYIVFSIVSTLCVGLLVYLYFPIKTGTLESSIIDVKIQDIDQVLPSEEPETEVTTSNSLNSEKSGRRMRLTQILIRTQKDLQMLEDQRKSSPEGLDILSEQKITKLRKKISNIEKIITEIE